MCIISVNENSVLPVFILPRVRYQNYLINVLSVGLIKAASPSGWIEGKVFVFTQNIWIKLRIV